MSFPRKIRRKYAVQVCFSAIADVYHCSKFRYIWYVAAAHSCAPRCIRRRKTRYLYTINRENNMDHQENTSSSLHDAAIASGCGAAYEQKMRKIILFVFFCAALIYFGSI